MWATGYPPYPLAVLPGDKWFRMCVLWAVAARNSLILQVQLSKIWKTKGLGRVVLLSKEPNPVGLGGRLR